MKALFVLPLCLILAAYRGVGGTSSVNEMLPLPSQLIMWLGSVEHRRTVKKAQLCCEGI